ncbi:MAG: hypothetical protein HRU40_15735 [Saprospiraceae bacterium]|nr:hypothetical protein [Saprospiraceae bacterium]
MKASEFDASPSALGYIYQVRYALFSTLNKIRELDDPDNHSVVIEKIDDISFHSEGTPKELLQTKHRAGNTNLTDKSPDIWKTIRIWSELILSGEIDLYSNTFYLITTQEASDESLASYLSYEDQYRDLDKAIKLVNIICSQKVGKEIAKGVNAFNSLSEAQKIGLLSRIEVVAKSKDITKIGVHLRNSLKLNVTKEHLTAYIERLEGYWFNKAIECLKGNISSISLSEVIYFFDDLRNQFLPTNLPNDYSDTDIGELGLEDEDKCFLQQIKLFTESKSILSIAKENYYRTYAQVLRWQSDGLLQPNEMTKYRNKLSKEWRNINSLSEMEHDTSCEKGKVLHAKSIYKHCQLDSIVPIRLHFDEPYVCRGTYHYLADNLHIGWHPEYLSLLDSSNDEDVA